MWWSKRIAIELTEYVQRCESINRLNTIAAPASPIRLFMDDDIGPTARYSSIIDAPRHGTAVAGDHIDIMQVWLNAR